MTNLGVSACPAAFDSKVQVLIIGAGACGLVTALRAHNKGAEVLVVERDSSPSGSTSLSSGFIPAAGTRFQRQAGITDDTPVEFSKDILAKSQGQSLPAHTALACENIAQAMEWLADEYRVPWIVLDDFLYPGHRFHRMHAVPEKTGEALQGRLLSAVQAEGIPVATESTVTTLFKDTDKIKGVDIVRPDGTSETIACDALVLACNGFGGNSAMVSSYIPEISAGQYYGHPGNTGDAVTWGEQLGAQMAHLSGYQGHGSVAHPHGVLITWALMMEGGIQVNIKGERFSNEHGGYSEQAVNVLAQPGKIAWCIYDERIHRFAGSFPDYLQACSIGAIKSADTVENLAAATELPAATLSNTLHSIEQCQQDSSRDLFGRSFASSQALMPPWYAVKVTGALFHTQGGLVVDNHCRVIKMDGSVVSNLLAGGGAACGVSGPDVSGYLSGNGLLTAIAYGFVAGESAAKIAVL